MKLRAKKQKGCVKEVDKRDRLSELPDEILVHILSFLPTIDAVRTMLIRRFARLWTLITSLDFDADDFADVFGGAGRRYPDYGVVRSKCFSKFVRNVLMFHRAGKINTFKFKLEVLYCWKNWSTGIDDVHIWIQWAMNRDAEVVNLNIDNYFPLPLHLLKGQSLVDLVLKACLLEPQMRLHLGSVTRLALHEVIMDGPRKITSGLPVLEDLTLDNCLCSGYLRLSSESLRRLRLYVDNNFYHCFNIKCPNLQMFDFRGNVHFTKLSDLSSIYEASIKYVDCFENPISRRCFKSFLKGLQNAEILTLNAHTCKQLTLCSTQELGFPCNRWKHVNLKLRGSDFVGICSLLKKSLYLEELVIGDDQWECEKVREELFSQEVSSPCVAPRLKFVHIFCCKELDDRLYLLLAKYLLTAAVVLDKLVFRPSEKLSARKKRQLVKRFSDIPRASLKAKVLVENR